MGIRLLLQGHSIVALNCSTLRSTTQNDSCVVAVLAIVLATFIEMDLGTCTYKLRTYRITNSHDCTCAYLTKRTH